MKTTATPRLSVKLGSLALRNPIMPASGTFDWLGEGPEISENLGAFVSKSVTLHPQPGNPPQRVAETPEGMLNAIGIPSAGLETFLSEYLPYYRRLQTALIVSVQAYTPEEAREMAAALGASEGVAAIELNLSCPNLQHGEIIAQSPRLTAEVVEAARETTEKPLIAKLSPNVTSISEIAHAAEKGGADALCLINTVRGMAVDVLKRRALLGHEMGGLSGPAIKPIALSMVWECYGATELPIVGTGGIRTTQDALEFLMAGASAVQVGTATFREPGAMADIVEGLAEYATEQRLDSLSDLVGLCHIDGGTEGG